MGRIVVRSVGDLFVMSIMRFALMSVSRPIRQTAGPTNHLRLAEVVPVELMPRFVGISQTFYASRHWLERFRAASGLFCIAI